MSSTPVREGVQANLWPAKQGGQRAKGAGAVQAKMRGATGGPGTDDKACHYEKGGRCNVHGPGAKLHWKPRRVATTGPDGRKVFEVKRHYFYECDLAPVPRGMVAGRGIKVKQTKMTFLKQNMMKTDTVEGVVGASTDFSLSRHADTCSVGQTVGYEATGTEEDEQ